HRRGASVRRDCTLRQPALVGAHTDTGFLAGTPLAGACLNGIVDPHDKLLPLRVGDQSSSLSSQRALSFFLKANSAAVSASAFSLRCSSFSNCRIRLRACLSAL